MLTIFRNKFSFITALVIVTLFVSAFIPVKTVLAQDLKGVVPATIGPLMTTLDTTPIYKWTKVTGATHYQYQVYMGTTLVLDKSPDAGICGATTCQKEPAFTLGLNAYKWRVRAKVGWNTWTAWSAFRPFYVSPPPFAYEFNGNKVGWARIGGGSWATVLSKYLYTDGLVGQHTSIYNTRGQYSDFDFSAQVYRFGSLKPNYIMVRMGTLVDAGDKEWYPGYEFGYTNEGEFAVLYATSSTSHVLIQDWTYTPAIVKNGWNTLQVQAYGKTFKYYINGTLVKSFTSSVRPRGYVGFMTYKATSAEGRFYVNWAKLSVYTTAY